MTEKIAYEPGRVTRLAGVAEIQAARDGKHGRAFADFLAEAEAVRDVVRMGARVVPATPASRGVLPAAWHGMAGLLFTSLPKLALNLRGGKPRRESA